MVAGYQINGRGQIVKEKEPGQRIKLFEVKKGPLGLRGPNQDQVQLCGRYYALAELLVASFEIPPFFMPGGYRGIDELFWEFSGGDDLSRDEELPNVGYARVEDVKHGYYDFGRGRRVKKPLGHDLYFEGEVLATKIKNPRKKWLTMRDYCEWVFYVVCHKTQTFGCGATRLDGDEYEMYKLPRYCVLPFGEVFGICSRICHRRKTIIVHENDPQVDIMLIDGEWQLITGNDVAALKPPPPPPPPLPPREIPKIRERYKNRWYELTDWSKMPKDDGADLPL